MISDCDAVLSAIDARLSETAPGQIPQLLSPLPLAVWGELLLEIPAKYANLKALFPSMPSEATQIHWTGNHGAMLLSQSIAFVESLVNGYQALTRRSLERARVLDFGCGWGRIIRLLYKYVGYENIFAVDAWDEPIALCKRHGVKARLAILDLHCGQKNTGRRDPSLALPSGVDCITDLHAHVRHHVTPVARARRAT